ncbi:methionine--tRNA ligase [candidate division WWE3 bacterium]|jgi:methionyl-tRNA synthetase|uniref:Methionine--tRNA ligase n=1 Tax=candidate division WWE3 bacterium TaxID=2053526 RepID=A0A3A4ZFF4_UNCKA|nr:MAG: methionine--tRNA ligase [candidate division WWE3 bacterium]
MHKKVLIGVAWPYVNGELHIGHLAGYLLPADICARYHRSIGNQVLMVSGSDCFGTPITLEADKRKITPDEVVKDYHQKDTHLFREILDLSYDLYTLTNHPNHIKVTQDFFIKMLEGGYLFIDKTKQYYSPTQNRFLPDRYVVGECPFCGTEDTRSDQCDSCGKLISHGELLHPRSNLTGEDVEFKDTEHYFVDWPKLQPRIEKYVETAGRNWKDWVNNETLGWLKEGLKPRAITRDLDWGVPIPVDRIPQDLLIENANSKRIYVWFDAVIGYFSASLLWATINEGKWEDFWFGENLKHYYFMGKDNLVFHTLFWPGQLMVYNSELHLPDVVSINMFLNLDGKQFSKSRGVVLKIEDIVEKYGNDLVRFYLTLIMPETRDSSFVWSDLYEKVNGVLVANLGNFIHRTLSLYKGQKLAKTNEINEVTTSAIRNAFRKSRDFLESCQYRNYLDSVLELTAYGNLLVDKHKVWELKKTNTEEFEEVMTQLLGVVVAIGYLINPLLPEGSSRLSNYTGLRGFDKWPEDGKEIETINPLIKEIIVSDGLKPLFTKLDKTQDTF